MARAALCLLLISCGQSEWTALGRPTKGTSLRQIFAFDGKLYLGHGDATANTGATDVLAFDPATKEFRREFSCDDETIARYRMLDGALVIPGADATEDWKWGNVYVRSSGSWVKHRTVPNAVHVLDVASFRGKWYAAAAIKTEAEASVAAIFESSDGGKSWSPAFALPASKEFHARMGTLAVLGENLYAFPYAYEGDRYIPDPWGTSDTIVFDGKSWKMENHFEGSDLTMVRTVVTFQNQLVIHAVFGKNVLFGNRGEPLNLLMTFAKPLAGGSIKDVEVCGDRLVLLTTDSLRTTQDLEHWDTIKPPDRAESAWVEGGRVYVGAQDGTLFSR